jgi:Icc protein
LLIAHISDIHCGPEFVESSFQQAVDEINGIKPDALVVSGDLTENGLLPQYRMARKWIDAIKCAAKVYCSGNHDYRSTGYLLFKEFFRSPPLLKLGKTVIATISTARPERNEGEVGHRQVVWLERSLARYKRFNKVAVMHHHLIQVPDTGPDNIPVVDAGDTLRAIAQSKVMLVLGGHRHRPWRWHVEGTQIVHAGTVSSERLRGFYAHSYNIITLKKDDVEMELQVVGKSSMDFKKVVKGRIRLPQQM